MWIVRLALRRPYTFVVLALAIILVTPLVLMRTPTDIFPEINIPVVTIAWTYTGLSPRDDHGQRYRAPGVAIPSRHDHHQALFSSASQYLYGAGANGRRHRDDDEVASAGRHSTARDHLLRFDRSGHSNRTHQRHHERAGAVRPRHHLSSSQVHHRARRGHPLAVRWKAAFHLGGYRFRGFAIEGPLSRGYRERHEPAEPHLADGNRKARPAGVQRGDEREPAHRGGAQRSAGQKRER